MAEVYKIVIADDEALICMDLKEMMEEAGHEVVGVGSDGVEALELTKKLNPDLVILDVKMPRLDGIQAAKMIAHDNLAPVVLLTAFGDEDIIEKAKKIHGFRICNETGQRAVSLSGHPDCSKPVPPEKRDRSPDQGHGTRNGCPEDHRPR